MSQSVTSRKTLSQKLLVIEFCLIRILLWCHASSGVCKGITLYDVTKTHHRIRFQEYYFDIKQMFEDGFIMLLHHLRQHLHIFEDGQPEVGDSFRFFIFVNPK